MKARPVKRLVKRARVVVDPIARVMPLVEDVWVDWDSFAFLPYKGPQRDWENYPVSKKFYPEYKQLDYQLGYVGRIHYSWKGNKGIYRLALRKRAKPKVQISVEQWLAYPFVTIEDKPWKKTFPPNILYKGKVYQAIWFARLAKVAFMEPIKAKENGNRSVFLKANPLDISYLYSKVLKREKLKMVPLLEERIPVSDRMSQVSIAPLSFTLLSAKSEKGVWAPVDFKMETAYWGKEVKIVDSKEDVPLKVEYGVYQPSSYDRAFPFLSLEIMRAKWLLAPTSKIKTIFDKRIKTVEQPSHVFKVDTPFYLSLSVPNGEARLESTDGKSAFLVQNSLVRQQGANLINTMLLINSQLDSIKQKVLSTSFYEDEAAEVESQEFFAGGESLKDQDIFVSLFKGGTADYYKTVPYFGWDTNARNPSGTALQYNRAKVNQTQTPQTSFRDFIPAFGTFPSPISALTEEISAFEPLNEAFKVELPTTSAVGLTKEATSSSKETLPSFGALKEPNTSFTEYQPEFGALEDAFGVGLENQPSFGDFLFEKEQVFLENVPSLGHKSDSKQVLIDYEPSCLEETSLKGKKVSQLGEELISSYWVNPISNLLEMDKVSTLWDNPAIKAPSEDRVSTTYSLPLSQSSSLYKVSTFYNRGFFNAESDKASLLWSAFLDEGVPEEDIWEPTGTWDDLRGEPATYFLTLSKQPVDKVFVLFKGKPISYIDIWKPYYVDSEGNFVNLPEELQRKGGYNGPYEGYSWIYNQWAKALGWREQLSSKAVKTLMQIGWGYTTPPKVSIDANKLSQDLKEEVLPIPQFLSYDILSDRVFTSGSPDTRDYHGPIVDRAKVEIRPFQEWVESVGAFAFVYALTMHFHIINSMTFEKQTFMGCAAKGLKIIGSIPKIPMP